MAIPTPVARITRFEKMGYGMFIHWGLYAQLGQGEWVQHLRKMPMDEYAQLKEKFTAEEFDGRKIAAIAREAGMKYITLTSRHHDGFSLYDTKGLSDHDAPHSAAGRDLVGELIEGCRAEGIAPHFYHTTLDWYQPGFNDDQRDDTKPNFDWSEFQLRFNLTGNEVNNRKNEDIPIEEYGIAGKEILKELDQIPYDDLVTEIARLFNFGVTGRKIRESVTSGIDWAINQGYIERFGDNMLKLA